MGPQRRILVVFESGARGEAALAHGVALTRSGDASLTVLALAPAQPIIRCGPCDDALDRAVADAAEWELEQARARVGVETGSEAASGDGSGNGSGDGSTVAYETLLGADARTLAGLIERRSFELVIVPQRRWLAGGHVRVRTVQRLVSSPVLAATEVSSSPARSTADSIA